MSSHCHYKHYWCADVVNRLNVCVCGAKAQKQRRLCSTMADRDAAIMKRVSKQRKPANKGNCFFTRKVWLIWWGSGPEEAEQKQKRLMGQASWNRCHGGTVVQWPRSCGCCSLPAEGALLSPPTTDLSSRLWVALESGSGDAGSCRRGCCDDAAQRPYDKWRCLCVRVNIYTALLLSFSCLACVYGSTLISIPEEDRVVLMLEIKTGSSGAVCSGAWNRWKLVLWEDGAASGGLMPWTQRPVIEIERLRYS